MPFELTVQILIAVFIVLAMFCVGLAVTTTEIIAAIQDRSKTAKALLANIVVAPIIAFIIVTLVPMPDAAAKVLLILGFAPGGINAVQFSTKSPGYLASAAGLLFVMSLAALVLAPFAAHFILDAGGRVAVPYGEVALRAGLLVVWPLIVGMLVRVYTPDLAEKLYKPAMLISTLSFIASVLTSMALRQDALGELGTGTLVGYLAFVLITMAVGWLLGGPERGHRQVLAVVTNLRNVGLVYVIVDACCSDPSLHMAVLAFMALMVPPNLILTLYSAFWRKKHGG